MFISKTDKIIDDIDADEKNTDKLFSKSNNHKLYLDQFADTPANMESEQKNWTDKMDR